MHNLFLPILLKNSRFVDIFLHVKYIQYKINKDRMQLKMTNNKEQPASQEVILYLMYTSSNTIKATLNKHLSFQELRQRIRQLFGIEEENQIIYYKGKMLDENSMPEFKQNTIMHVGDTCTSIEQNLTIFLIQYTSEKKNLFKTVGVKVSIEVRPDELVGQALGREMAKKGMAYKIEQCSFIQSGRFINKSKSFSQQNVHNKTQIQIIIKNSYGVKKVELQPFTLQRAQSHQQLLHRPHQSHQPHESHQLKSLHQPYQHQKHLENQSHSQHELPSDKEEAKYINFQDQQQEKFQSNIYDNPQSNIRKSFSPEKPYNNAQAQEKPNLLRKIKSAKSLRSYQLGSKYGTAKQPPMKFSMVGYKPREDGFVGERECNCASKKHMFRNMQCSQGRWEMKKSQQSRGLKQSQTIVS